MQMLVLINEDIHSAALEAARKIGGALPLPPGHALYAPLDDETSGCIVKIWDQTEAALGHALLQGMDAARPFITKVEELTVEVGTKLKERAKMVWTTIKERLNAYIQSVIDGALQRVRPTIAIGGQEMRVAKVSVEQRLMLSTSLKASLDEICEFIAEGELLISAEYQS